MYESLGLSAETKGGFIVVDYDRSTMILGGSAFTDKESVKNSLAALAAPSISSRDALPLSARFVYAYHPTEIFCSCAQI